MGLQAQTPMVTKSHGHLSMIAVEALIGLLLTSPGPPSTRAAFSGSELKVCRALSYGHCSHRVYKGCRYLPRPPSWVYSSAIGSILVTSCGPEKVLSCILLPRQVDSWRQCEHRGPKSMTPNTGLLLRKLPPCAHQMMS